MWLNFSGVERLWLVRFSYCVLALLRKARRVCWDRIIGTLGCCDRVDHDRCQNCVRVKIDTCPFALPCVIDHTYTKVPVAFYSHSAFPSDPSCASTRMLPVMIKVMGNNIRLQNCTPQAKLHQQRINECKKHGDQAGMAQAVENLKKVYADNNCNPAKSFGMILVQAPVFMSFFFGLVRKLVPVQRIVVDNRVFPCLCHVSFSSSGPYSISNHPTEGDGIVSDRVTVHRWLHVVFRLVNA